jgi:hypothetical protein
MATAVTIGVDLSERRESRILADTVDRADAQRVAIVFLDLIETTEFEPRQAHRLAAAKSAREMFLHLMVKMEPQFGVDVVFESRPPEERAQPQHPVAEH